MIVFFSRLGTGLERMREAYSGVVCDGFGDDGVDDALALELLSCHDVGIVGLCSP